MGYVGVPPQSGFITTAKQRVTSSTNNYVDLDHSISSLADVIVWVNFVKQDSTNLSLTTSTRITLGGTLVASDIVEIAYLGKAVATQTPDTGTVTNDMLAGSIANSKLATDPLNASNLASGTVPTARLGSGTASSSTFLRGDNSWASAGGANTPAFEAYKASTANVSNETYEKIGFDTEVFDVGGCYDVTNRRFLPTTAGKYFVYLTVWMSTESNGNFEVMWADIYKNGSSTASQSISAYSSNALRDCSLAVCSTVVMNGSSDYVEGWAKILDNAMSSNPRLVGGATASKFGAFRIIE